MTLTTPSTMPHTFPYLDLSSVQQAKLQEHLIHNGHELTLDETVLFLEVLQGFENIFDAITEDTDMPPALSEKKFQQLRIHVVLEFHHHSHYWVVGNCEDVLDLVDEWLGSNERHTEWMIRHA